MINFILKEEDIIIPKSGIVILYFYTSWMMFSKKILLNINNISNINFVAIDSDVFKNIIKKYGIKNVPFFLIFKNGKEIKRFMPKLKFNDFKEQLSNFVDDISLLD